MKKSNYKKLDTRSHFTDFWHNAKSWRENKHIGARLERRKLNKEFEEIIEKTKKEVGKEMWDRIYWKTVEAIENDYFTPEYAKQLVQDEYARWFITNSDQVQFKE